MRESSPSAFPPSQPSPPPARPPLQETNEVGDERDAPMRCSTDRDCPSLACGPCTTGDVVTIAPGWSDGSHSDELDPGTYRIEDLFARSDLSWPFAWTVIEL